MIFTESTIKISNNVSKMDSTIVLYRGDKNVEIRFTILQSPFKYSNTVATNVIESTNASYGQLVIKTPNDKPPIFSEVSATKEGTVLFTITKEMIDEIEEVGVYTFQIRLMDENKQSRVTIPPVENGIEIKEPIAIEDDNTTNVVGLAKANYAVATLSDVDTPAFDDNGQYIKTNWNDGDIITNASLNKIEDGIYTTNENITATKKYVDDNAVILPLPIHTTLESTSVAMNVVNIMDLIPGVQYSTHNDPNETKKQGYKVVYICDDGNFKTICNMPLPNKVVHLLKVLHYTNYSIISVSNTVYKVDYSKHSIVDDVQITKTLQDYLPITNTIEYNPTTDYHPATKKYVDDNMKTTINSVKGDLGTEELTTTAKDLRGAVNELNTQYKDIVSKIESGNIGSNIEPQDDDLPNVYITGTLPTAKSDGDLPITIHYISKTLDFKNYGTLKVQGASSAGYPKKNFTLKLYKDEQHISKDKKQFKQWGKLNKFVLKAHWMDCSHVRNVGTAKIWGKIAKSRSDYDTLPDEFKNSPNAGATDGFTVRVFANGIYQGLYEWIVPKDKLFGQDSDNPNHSILNSELNNNVTCAFNTTTPNVTTSAWSEELQDTLSPNIATSFSNLIKFVAGSTDTDFVANAENYFDVQSVIDYDIFARIFCIVDNLCRNQIFFTYDGTKWYEGVWDLDAVLGLPPTTRGFYAYNTEFQNGYIAYADYKVTNMLYKRVETLFMDRFKTRYKELRADILSIEGILHVYEKLTNVIKTYDGLLEEDYASTTGEGKFTGIPFQKENNIQQIRTFIAKRLIYMDECINNTYVPVPCTNITLNSNTLTFTDTTPQTLIATLTPTDTTDEVVWSVSPTGFATVENGVVTPIKNGACVITATCGTQSATCNVTVSGISEQPTPDGLLLKLDSSSLTNSSTTWEDLSGNGVNFNLTDGTPSVSDKGLLMSSVKVTGTKPITLNGAFSAYYCVRVNANRTGAFCSYNVDNLTKYCDSTEGGKLRINGYSGDNTTTADIRNPDKLQKIVVVRPSEGNTQVYLNGALQGTYGRGTFAANGNYDLVLGTSSYSHFQVDTADLSIKEFQIFNKALSEEEAIKLTDDGTSANKTTITKTLTQGKGLDKTTGELKEGSTNYGTCEEYIPVIKGNTYTINACGSWICICGYNSDKTFNKLITGGSVSATTFEFTNDCDYIRIGCTCTSATDNTITITGVFDK